MRRDESGVTVLELVVTCAVLSIVTVVLLQFLEGTTTITARSTQHVRTETDAQLALRQMTQELRSAKVIRACPAASYGTCVTVDVARPASATAAACPLRTVTFRLQGTNLLQDRTDYPTCTTPTTRYAARVLLPRVANGSTAVFTWLGTDGNPIDVVTAAALVPTAASVDVSLVAETGARNTPTLRFTAAAALRNNR